MEDDFYEIRCPGCKCLHVCLARELPPRCPCSAELPLEKARLSRYQKRTLPEVSSESKSPYPLSLPCQLTPQEIYELEKWWRMPSPN